MRRRSPVPTIIFLLALATTAAVLAGTVAAQDEDGTLRGVITIVGQDSLRDGEVVISPAGTHDVAGTAAFDSDDSQYQTDLPPGEYSAYAWAPVFHNSSRVTFTIEPNGTTWVNLTVVRLEEIIGLVRDTDGGPVDNAVVQFFVDGAVVPSPHSDADGRFRILMDPGTYHIVVTRSGFERLEMNLTIEPGQVLDLDLVLEPVPEVDDEEEFPLATAAVLVFIIFVLFGSIGYVVRQAHKMKRAAAEAEAARTRDFACPSCSASVSEGTKRCPKCDHVFQVRCDECGRSVDAGTERCPECGSGL